jgi:hypothetical protein
VSRREIGSLDLDTPPGPSFDGLANLRGQVKRTDIVLIFAVCFGGAGCSRGVGIEVLNTSGVKQHVTVTGPGLADVYWVDSLDTGKSLSWRVPDHARGERVTLWISAAPEEPLKFAPPEAPTHPWFDSLALDRSWAVQIHSPRFVEATPAWAEERKQREAEVARWFASAIKKGIIPPDELMKARAGMLHDSRALSSRDAPHFTQNVETRSQRASGFLILLVGSGLAMWAIIFAASRWLLSRSKDSRRSSRILVVGVAAIGALVALWKSGDDSVPSYLVGSIVGSALVLLFPIAVAIVIDSRRRMK